MESAQNLADSKLSTTCHNQNIGIGCFKLLIIAVNETEASSLGSSDITGFDELRVLHICWRYLDSKRVR